MGWSGVQCLCSQHIRVAEHRQREMLAGGRLEALELKEEQTYAVASTGKVINVNSHHSGAVLLLLLLVLLAWARHDAAYLCSKSCQLQREGWKAERECQWKKGRKRNSLEIVCFSGKRRKVHDFRVNQPTVVVAKLGRAQGAGLVGVWESWRLNKGAS